MASQLPVPLLEELTFIDTPGEQNISLFSLSLLFFSGFLNLDLPAHLLS